MSSDDEDGGNYACDGYDCDGYDCDECGYDDAKEVVRTINDVYDEDEEYKLLQTCVRNLELQMSALVKRVNALQMKVVELGGTPYDENDYPEDDEDIAGDGLYYDEDDDYDENDDYDPDQYCAQDCESSRRTYCPECSHCTYCHCHCA